MEKSYENF